MTRADDRTLLSAEKIPLQVRDRHTDSCGEFEFVVSWLVNTLVSAIVVIKMQHL